MFALKALQRLGESNRDAVASALGQASVFRTLVRLESDGRIISRDAVNTTTGRTETLFRLADSAEVD